LLLALSDVPAVRYGDCGIHGFLCERGGVARLEMKPHTSWDEQVPCIPHDEIDDEMGDGRWEMGDGRWEMGDGRWEMGDGRWTMR
jgi:hypothetical protein